MRALYVETTIRADLDVVWQRTQDPTAHQRWDLRFTRITAASVHIGQPWRFRYAVRVLPRCWLTGDGVSTGERHRPDGTRTSALRFRPHHRWSPLGPGAGYWRYQPTADGVRFLTGYDYRPGWGGADRVVRPLLGWATAWSFDRLRLWLERGLPPETTRWYAVAEAVARAVLVGGALVALGPGAALGAAVVAVLVPPLPTTPAARRCRRRPARPTTAPASLRTLPPP